MVKTGLAFADSEYIKQIILSEYCEGNLLKEIVEIAYDIKALNKDIDMDIKKVIICFYEINISTIIPYYNNYLLGLGKKDKAAYKNVIKKFILSKSIRIVEAFLNQDLWDKIGIQLYYLFFYEIDGYISGSIARQIDRFDTQTVQNNNSRKYVINPKKYIELEISNFKKELTKYIYKAARKRYSEIRDVVLSNNSLIIEFDFLATALSYDKNGVNESESIRKEIELAVPESVVDLLYNQAVGFDKANQFDRSIETWNILIEKLEKHDQNIEVFEELIEAYQGLSITCMKACEYQINNLKCPELVNIPLTSKFRIKTEEEIVNESDNLQKQAIKVLLDCYEKFDMSLNNNQRESVLSNLFMILNKVNYDVYDARLKKIFKFLKRQIEEKSVLCPLFMYLLYSKIIILNSIAKGGKSNPSIRKVIEILENQKSFLADKKRDDIRIYELLAEAYFLSKKYTESFALYAKLISIRRNYFTTMLEKFLLIDDSVFFQLKSVFSFEGLDKENVGVMLQSFSNALEEYANENERVFDLLKDNNSFEKLKRFKKLFPINIIVNVRINLNGRTVYGKSILDDDFNSASEYLLYLSTLKKVGETMNSIKKVINDLDGWTFVLVMDERLYSINAAQKYKKQFDLMNNNPSLYAEVSLYIGTVIKTYEELIAEAVVKREESKLNISEKKYLDAIKILKKEKNIFLLVYDEKDYKSMLREATAYLSDIYFDRFEFFLRKGTDFDQAKKNLDKIKNLFSLAHMTVLSNYIRMYCVFKMYDEAVQLINNTDNSKLICDKLNIESWLSINIGDIYAGKFAFLINNNSGEENELINCGNNALKYYLLAKDFINSNDFPTENRAVIENNIAVISSILNELNDSY